MRTIHVSASRSYDVCIGGGLLDEAGARMRPVVAARRVMLAADDTVAALYGARCERALRAAGYETETFVFPHGERSKNGQTLLSLLNRMAEIPLTRRDAVAALGGGVTGDLAGFAAACYMRGIPCVQLPTTLLAAVDSSVGGKTAVDLPAGKNLAGAFWQPSLVLCDCGTLATLPEPVFADGCAEVIKYGVIADEGLFADLHAPLRPQLESVIARCVAIKRDAVQGDEFEHGSRKLLNFGHTVGHAAEACSAYSISHGRAVAMGMAAAARAAWRMGICSRSCPQELEALLEQYGLPRTVPFGREELAAAMRADKKRDGDCIDCILPEQIGRCVIRPVRLDALDDFLRAGLEALA